jgi:hypothetical protein
MIFRKYSFQKQTKFAWGNKVLDAEASNTHGVLEIQMCFFISAEEAYLEQTEPISTL